MRAYAPQYSQAALDALLSASARRRRKARVALEDLCGGVPGEGDFCVRDDDGRVWEVILIDGVVLTADSAGATWEDLVGDKILQSPGGVDHILAGSHRSRFRVPSPRGSVPHHSLASIPLPNVRGNRANPEVEAGE